jgi:hypothetical protein
MDESYFARMDQFKYLVTNLKNPNFIREETKWRLKSGNACYRSVQNILSSSLLSENIKIKIHRTIILNVFLYGCENWSPRLREGRRLRAFENRVLWRIFGPKRDKVTGDWNEQHNEELNDLYSTPNIMRMIKSKRIRWAGDVAHMGRVEVLQGFGEETWWKEAIWKAQAL